MELGILLILKSTIIAFHMEISIPQVYQHRSLAIITSNFVETSELDATECIMHRLQVFQIIRKFIYHKYDGSFENETVILKLSQNGSKYL